MNRMMFVYFSAYIGYGYMCFLMVQISLQYLPLNTDVAFLRIKQDVIGIPYYAPAFFIHAFSSLFILPAGFIQFSGSIRTRFPALHRQSGYLYFFTAVFVSAPSGFLIGLHANGGTLSKIGFCMLAVLWIFFSVKALLLIRQGKVLEHRNYMLRSFALAMSAISLRAWKVVLVMLFEPHPMDLYRLVAWLSWIGNLIIVEAFIFLRRRHES